MSKPVFDENWPDPETLWRMRQQFERDERASQERRVHERKNVYWAARLVLPEGAYNCTVYDLSLGGARVRLVAELNKFQRVRLDFDKLAPLNADVVWLGIGMVGIRFTDDPAYVSRVLSPLMVGGASGTISG
ncbi:MAG TPA: PilZ domain-containing protein [Stellaceae bacterium]|jgi:hypothetical protein|nr:PilZ domain-containing protein [Stellaceae bacterium]